MDSHTNIHQTSFGQRDLIDYRAGILRSPEYGPGIRARPHRGRSRVSGLPCRGLQGRITERTLIHRAHRCDSHSRYLPPRRTVKWHGQDRANPPEPPVKRHRGEPGHTRGTAQYRAFQYLSRFLYPYPSDIYYRSPIDGTHWLPNKEMTKLWEVSDETRRTIPALSVSDTPV